MPPLEGEGFDFAALFSEAKPDEPNPPRFEDSETAEVAPEDPEVLAPALPMPLLWQPMVINPPTPIADTAFPSSPCAIENAITPPLPSTVPLMPDAVLADAEPAAIPPVPLRFSADALSVPTQSPLVLPRLQAAVDDPAAKVTVDTRAAIDPGLPPQLDPAFPPQSSSLMRETVGLLPSGVQDPVSVAAFLPTLPPPLADVAPPLPAWSPPRLSPTIPESPLSKTTAVRVVPRPGVRRSDSPAERMFLAKTESAHPPQTDHPNAPPVAQVVATVQTNATIPSVSNDAGLHPVNPAMQSHHSVPAPKEPAHSIMADEDERAPEPPFQTTVIAPITVAPVTPSQKAAADPMLADTDSGLPPTDPDQLTVPVAQWGIDSALQPALPLFVPPALAQINAVPIALPMMPSLAPKPLAPTLAKIARDTTTGAVELSLAPAELGRMHMTFVHDGDLVRVTLTAERPETLDLLRRNADQLNQEFRQAGFAGSTLNFGQWGSGNPTPQQPPAKPDSAPFPAVTSFEPPPQTPLPKPVLGGLGLDLRL